MPTQRPDLYHVERLIWTGEVAEICRAAGPDGQLVALKRIRHGISGRRAALRSLEREARIGRMLDHPNVIEVIHFIPDPVQPVMVMEYFASRNAKVRLLAPRGDDLLDYETKDILLQMACSLRHMHERSMIHMDIKPENFLISDEGTVKLTDFAIAVLPVTGWRRLFRGRRRIAGTRSYIAPETLRRKEPDLRTDIYSFGVTLYEILARRPPFQAENRDEILAMHLRTQPVYLRSYDKNLTAEIDELVIRMLEKDPAKRPQSMADVVARIERAEIFKEPRVKPPPQEAER